jgi:hypothetical protein
MTERDEASRDLEYCVDMWMNGEEAALHINTIRTIRAALQSPVPEEWREAVRGMTEVLKTTRVYIDNWAWREEILAKHASVIEAAQKGGGDD